MRVVTRGDMDGLTGSVIVSLHEEVDEIELIHPQDITSARADIRPKDILINVPFHPKCALWFDHHQHTATYEKPPDKFKGSYGLAPSAARLVYEFYGGRVKMPQLEELVAETDRMDSADLTPDDVLNPQGYIRLGFTIDSRSGIGSFKPYFRTLFELLRTNQAIEVIVNHPAVARRYRLMQVEETRFREALRRHSRVDANVVITDFRSLDHVPAGNRFVVYALYPNVNVSVRIHWGPGQAFLVAALGHSIFNRTCTADLGLLAKRHGGGGHRGAASIPLLVPGQANSTIAEIVAELKRG
jgi:hypothetical protein